MINKIVSITVTYNPDMKTLLSHLNSIEEQVSKIILVDNNSNNIDQIVDVIEHKVSVEIIRQSKNVGLATAQNIGIRAAIESGAEYFILFDQDSVVSSNFVSGLETTYIELIKNGVKVGAVGPSFYDPTDGTIYPPTNYVGPFIRQTTLTSATAVSFLIASGCFVSKSAFMNVGEMKDDLFIDYIDVEWSFRAKKFGYSVFMTNRSSMSHTIGDARKKIFGRTISVHSPLRRYYLIRNSFFMIRQSYIPLGYKVRELVFNGLRFLLSVLFSEKKIETIKYSFYGFFHGIFNRLGPFS